MIQVELDGRKMDTRQDAHRLLKEKLGLPSYYGGNLDALHDCLTDMGEETRVTLTYRQAMLNALGAYGQSLLAVFRDAAAENPAFAFIEK